MNGGLASIIAASLGAIGAAVGLIITKENKTSEFRQDWINGLRTSLSDFIGYITKINENAIAGKAIDKEDIIKFNSLRSDIRLRLNNKEPSRNETKLLAKMAKLTVLAFNGTMNIADALDETTAASAAVLKSEWARVKKGEVKYRTCVYAACFLALIAISIPVMYSFYHYREIWKFITGAAH